MATYYLRATNGSDLNGGTSWADAVQSFPALNALLATNGDIGLIDMESASTLPITSTQNNANRIILKGVDQSDSVTPKTFVLDGQSTAQDCLFLTGAGSQVWDGEFRNAARYGFVPGTTNLYGVFVRVKTVNAGAAGFYNGDTNVLINCEDSGSPIGSLGGVSKYLWCKFSNNSTRAMTGDLALAVDYCIFENTPIGVFCNAQNVAIRNCVFYDCDVGVSSTIALDNIEMTGNRFENCSTGPINFTNAGTHGIMRYNTFFNNGATKNIQNVVEIDSIDSAQSNFVNAAAGNFSTLSGADNTNIGVAIGADPNGISESFYDAGLHSEASQSGGAFINRGILTGGRL